MSRSAATFAQALILLILLAACASQPRTYSNVDTAVDFGDYETFGFFDPLATDEQGYESLVSSFLKAAISQEMAARGLSYSGDPDLLVNVYIHTKEKIRSRETPTISAYYGYRDPFFYDPWIAYPAYTTTIEQYTEGTLNIDVVDAAQKKLVWEGLASGRVTDYAIRNLEESIDEAVAAIFEDFPVAAPASQ